MKSDTLGILSFKSIKGNIVKIIQASRVDESIDVIYRFTVNGVLSDKYLTYEQFKKLENGQL